MTPAPDILSYVQPGQDLIVSSINGSPSSLLLELENAARANDPRVRGVTIHQMHPLCGRAYMTEGSPIRYVSYFLSGASRAHLGAGVEHVVCNFSQIPELLRERATNNPLVLASVAAANGRAHWGTNADYVAALVRDGTPWIAEVNRHQPAVSPIDSLPVTAYYVEHPLLEHAPTDPNPVDDAIGAYAAELIPDGATIQMGIGSIPDAVTRELRSRTGLRVWSELLTDGVVDLFDAGALHRTASIVGTISLGTRRLHEFLERDLRTSMRPVDEVNDPAALATRPHLRSVCATTEVDLRGQCASETVGGRYYSGAGGQLDFMAGASRNPEGRGIIVLRSTAKGGTVPTIVPTLSSGSVVTTPAHYVDTVVTEYGVAELRGRTLSERAAALRAIAHPRFRGIL